MKLLLQKINYLFDMKDNIEKTNMKAIRFHQYGGPEVLVVEQISQPEPGPGQIKIAVKAAAVNQIDFKLRAGYLHEMMPITFPSGVGFDASGIVTAIGKNVNGVALGDAVLGTGQSAMAEYAILNEWVHKPLSLSFEEAAGYPGPAETAVRILEEIDLKAGETLLLSGAAGGVGSAVIQLAKNMGIHTIGTASEIRHDYLKGLGTVPTTYGPGLPERVIALVPNGVQAAVDIAGSGILPDLIEITGDPTKVLTLGDFSADKYGAKSSFVPRNLTQSLQKAVKLFETGQFTLPVAAVFSMNQIAQAQELSAGGHAKGRIIIKIDEV